MLIRKAFNYLTLILAIITIFMAISVYRNDESPVLCLVVLAITLISNHISRKYNEAGINLNKKDKELLEKLKNSKKEK